MPKQLLLPLEKRQLRSFMGFEPTKNHLVVNTLQNWTNEPHMIYLHGPAGSGKTHLAEALTEKMLDANQQVLFVSGADAPPVHFFYDLPEFDLLILDDLDTLLSFSERYEEALFTLYNYIFDKPHARLFVTAATPIEALPVKLKDLHSRLKSMLYLHLAMPSAEMLIQIMQKQAAQFNFILTEEMLTLMMQQRQQHPTDLLNAFIAQSARDKKKPSITYLKHFLNLMIQ